MDAAFKSFFLVCIIVLAVLTFFCLVRTIKGPRLVDRIVGTNMIGTMTIAICGCHCTDKDLYWYL